MNDEDALGDISTDIARLCEIKRISRAELAWLHDIEAGRLPDKAVHGAAARDLAARGFRKRQRLGIERPPTVPPAERVRQWRESLPESRRAELRRWQRWHIRRRRAGRDWQMVNAHQRKLRAKVF